MRRGSGRPRYYANDHSRDLLDIAPVEMDIADARTAAPTLDGVGFTLLGHRSAVADFADRSAVDAWDWKCVNPEVVETVRLASRPPAPAILR